MKAGLGQSLIGPLAATVLVALVVALTTDRFVDAGNLRNLALQVSIVALVGIGSTLVIVTGGIDLSPGSAIALMTMVFAVLVKFGGVDLWLGHRRHAPARRDAGRAQRHLDGISAHPGLHHDAGGLERLSRHRLHVQQRLARLRGVAAARAAVLRLGLRLAAAAALCAGLLRGRSLVDALDPARPLDLCGRRQSARGAPVRDQRQAHAAPGLPAGRVHGRGRRRPDGRPAQFGLAQLWRRARAAGDCRRGDRRRQLGGRTRQRAGDTCSARSPSPSSRTAST